MSYPGFESKPYGTTVSAASHCTGWVTNYNGYNSSKSSGCVVVYNASKSQVRGSNPGLGKVNSAFHPFSGSIKENQACLETEHWRLHVKLTT
ncbi:hypothetical protein TNCV_3329081 [Trichonephila clavipes]|nr:hypothetical protein TNCV_3329081 [Trichonephila clavipes]